MKNVLTFLRERDFLDQVTHEEMEEVLNSPQKIYLGFDMTADSLHLGNLVGLILLRWFQKFGHTPVVLLGGATTKIGDPSGKSKERPLLDPEEAKKNFNKIKAQVGRFFDDKGPKPVILNNDDWLAEIPIIDFMRDVGKHFRMGTMLSKESVKLRVNSDEGMSFTEFCYSLLQGYDFYYLSKNKGILFQGGGSDQWGNITAGIELTRKKSGISVFGITFPLLTRSDGRKFGKSESGAIWLDQEKTSPFALYQYLYQLADADVGKMLRMLTFLDTEKIRAYEKALKEGSAQPNEGQKLLAEEVTKFVHGDVGLEAAKQGTKGAAFGQKIDAESLRSALGAMPTVSMSKSDVVGKRFTELVAFVKLASSKGEAHRLVKNGGAYLNNEKVLDPAKIIEHSDLIEGEFLLLGSGKKKKSVIQID
ncbi:MAG: tyrosine--tRNA ligase [Candidatus Algichlamydia australiensis]|nr:tyrosine--tRNA ligase [Chlamydiales bacterium]